MQPTIMGWPSETLEAGPPSLGYTHWSIKSAGVGIILSLFLSLRMTTEGPKLNVVDTKACTIKSESCESTNVKQGVFCPRII